MSFDSDDDDDIERRLDELTNELSELNRLLRNAITSGEREGEGRDRRTPQEADFWNVGDTAPTVDSMAEYRRLRIVSSNSRDIGAPMLSPEAYEDREERIENRIRVFEDGIDNLSSARARLGKRDFREFLNQYVLIRTSEDPPVTETIRHDLVEAVNPSPQFWGVSEVDGEISVTPAIAALQFLRAYNYLWHPEAEPWNALRKGPRPPDTDVTETGRTVIEMNQKMAVMAFERSSIEFKEKWAKLLPDDKQDEWRSE